MTEVISVRFRSGTKSYYFDPRDLKIGEEQYVVVETAQGIEYARCVEGNHMVPDQSVVQPLRAVVRIATENDQKAAAYNRKREKEAFDICEKKIAEHRLEMKLVNVECNFEGNKIIFFFTAEGRVDFRDLVKDLASVFRSRIELRQIGVRDEAKMMGGLGICGRPLCCSEFMDDFIPVSIKMAKTQNLSLNPTKISGTCGRLMCCLKYEQNAYEDASKRMPKSDSFVDTPDGIGNISSVDLLREQVQVRLDSAPEAPKRYKNCEIRVLRNGKGSREGIEIPRERPARAVPPEVPVEERFGRPGMIRDAIAIPSVLAEEPAREDAAQAASGTGNRRRRNRRGGKGSAASAGAAKAPSGERAAAPEREGGRKRTPENAERREKQPERVEKVPVRTATDTTQAKKAAADRAAQQQKGPGGEKAVSGEGKARRRRPRHRPRGKSGGGQATEE